MISEELGEDDDTTAEAEEYRRKITALHLDEDREEKLLKEVDRLSKMQSSNQEGTVIRTYLDTCLDLPWNTFTVDDLDIGRAQAGTGRQSPNHLPCRPSGRGQDQYCTLHRRKSGPQVCAHQPWRRAG